MNRHSQTMAFILLSCSVILLFSACQSSQTAPLTTKKPPAYSSEKAPDTADLLTDKTWLLSGFLKGTLYIPLEPDHGSSTRMRLLKNGTLEGNTGFNTFKGSWSISGKPNKGFQSVTFRYGLLTKMAAPTDTGSQFEQLFLRHISEARAIHVTSNTLEIQNVHGLISLSFLRR